MDGKLPSELQRGAVHGVILFFEGHVFKALGNSFVPSGSHHIFAFDWKCGCGVARRLQEEFIGNFPVGVDWAWSSFSISTELSLYFIQDGLANPPGVRNEDSSEEFVG